MNEPNSPTPVHSSPLTRPRAVARFFRGKRLVTIIAVLVGATALFCIWFFTRPSDEGAEGEVSAIVSVKTVAVGHAPIADEISAVGTVSPKQQAVVSARLSGQISQMGILKNRPVRAGDVIAQLDVRDLRAQRAEAAAALDEARLNLRGLSAGTIPQNAAQADKALRDARANVANAKALYERRKALFQKGGIAQKDLEASQLALTLAEDDLRLAETSETLRARAVSPNDRALAESRVKQAEQRLANLDAQIGFATVTAPFGGVVTDQFQFRGEYVTPGAKLVTLSDLSEIVVKAQFPDTVAPRIANGDEVALFPSESTDRKFSGRISLISKSGDAQSRTVEVWVTIPAAEVKEFRVGGAVRVVVATSPKPDALTLPVSAVTFEAGSSDSGTVMVVDKQSVAHEVKVKTGIRSGGRIEIVSGVKPGDNVIIEGNFTLPDGTKVKTESEEEKKDKGEKDDEKKEKT